MVGFITYRAGVCLAVHWINSYALFGVTGKIKAQGHAIAEAWAQMDQPCVW